MTKVHKLVSVAGLVSALVVSVSAMAEPEQANRSAYQPPRNSQGHPDIQGVWDFRTLTPLERPKALADKAVFSPEEQQAFRQQVIQTNDTDSKKDLPAEFDVEGAYNSFWYDFGTVMNEDRRTSLIVDPPNGRLPDLTPQAVAEMKQNLSRVPPVRDLFSFSVNPSSYRPVGPETLGLSERCLLGFNAGPPLTPSAYNNNLRIIQTPDHVVLVTEMIHEARIVPMDGSPHLPEDIGKWSGDSRGHWDGNTLVVKTTNFTDKTASYQMPLVLDALDQSGAVGSGENLRLTEKFTRISENRLVYEYTVDDSSTFTRPFTVVIPMRATEEQMFEYACHEGNYALAGMLKGARLLEKEEAIVVN